MKLFNSGAACHLSGITSKQLNDWSVKRIITAHQGGRGQGDHRLWTPMQVVGLIVANQIRNSERSCALSYVRDVVKAFGQVTEEWLTKQFEKHNTHLVMIHQGKPLLRSKDYEWADVQAAYEQVQEAAKDL